METELIAPIIVVSQSFRHWRNYLRSLYANTWLSTVQVQITQLSMGLWKENQLLLTWSHSLSSSQTQCKIRTRWTPFTPILLKHLITYITGFFLLKAHNFEVDGSLLDWLESYLSNRSQSIRLGTTLSRTFTVTSGVPQGSHLGPLLFALFINDLCDELTDCKFLLYADDLKLFRIVNTVDDELMLQKNLTHVQQWCLSNNMSLNVKKCEAISFSRKQGNNSYYLHSDVSTGLIDLYFQWTHWLTDVN